MVQNVNKTLQYHNLNIPHQTKLSRSLNIWISESQLTSHG